MAATANFFVRTDVGIGQLAIELASAYEMDFCALDREGATFSVSLSELIGVHGDATIDISATDLRAYGDPGLNKDTALELFEYDVEIEFSRNTSNAFRGETDRLGRALYDLFRKRSRLLRPMVYVVDEGTNIAAVSLPGRETQTVDPAAFIRDAALREEMASAEVREFEESPVPAVPENEALCLFRATDDSVYIQPLLCDASRAPAPPGVAVDLEPGIQSLLGEACATALWRSSTATTGETVHYEESAVDSLGMNSQQLVLQAHADAGRLVLSAIEQVPGDASASRVPGDVEFDGPAPESYERLGALLINALTDTSGSSATG